MSVKGDHSVGGVPYDDKLGPDVVRFAFYRYQSRRLMLKKRFDQFILPHQTDGIWKGFFKEFHDLFPCTQLPEHLERHEEGGGPGGVPIRQRYHHELTSWPNVEVVGGHAVAPFWWYGQFQVAVFDVLLAELEQRSLLHGSAKGTERAVGSNDQVGCVFGGFASFGAETEIS